MAQILGKTYGQERKQREMKFRDIAQACAIQINHASSDISPIPKFVLDELLQQK